MDGVKLMVSGAAAVLVFFVVSGFCIHLPNLDRQFSIRAFLVRRFLRLGIPLAGASVIVYAVGVPWFQLAFGTTVIWSLACEAIYYVMYALIAHRMNQRRWFCLFVGSLIIAGVVAVVGRENLQYATRGVVGATLLGLPIWISGVLMAERFGRVKPSPKLLRIALWLGVLLGGAVATVLKVKLGVSFAFTLTVYGILVAPWLLQNLQVPIWRGLCFLGAFSYSLYLLHLPLIGFFRRWAHDVGVSNMVLADILVAVGVLASSVAFYFLIELPGHRLARYISRLPFLGRRGSVRSPVDREI